VAEPRTTVTALRERRRGRVVVELDEQPWRVVPVNVVARAGLRVGLELDRPTLRLLRRELRRAEALGLAGRALRARDLSQRALSDRLEGRVAPAAREEALETLARVGVLDDRRVAQNRAAALAARGYGDAAIRHDLTRRGLEPDEIEDAIATLEPEALRVSTIVERRGPGPATARHLAARGFGEEAVASAVDDGFASHP
jgi:SOS response regulatory protein OraA/RecX